MYLSLPKREHVIENNCLHSYPDNTRVFYESRDIKIVFATFDHNLMHTQAAKGSPLVEYPKTKKRRNRNSME